MSAPGQRVFELARDIARWPTLLPHYRKVTVLSRTESEITAQMSATRPLGPLGIPVGWQTRAWADASIADDLRLRFVHTAGATRGMDVTWHITPRGQDGVDGSHVVIEHDFVRPLPIVGPDLVPSAIDRLFVRPIAGKTLATFNRLAESDSGT